jgi:arylsulfatase A-like enzyme/Flp pilus assembly protein TadD
LARKRDERVRKPPVARPRPWRVRARIVLPVAAGLLALAAAWALVRRERPRAVTREPGLDVLLITVDTLRADALGAYGSPRARTPWIDRLAASGVRFDRAHAHNVVTLPSHANILSGRYPFEHGVRDNAGFRFPAGVDTLATRLRALGYRTGAFVSAFPLDSRFGLDRGFDVYDDAFADGRAAADFMLPERHAVDTVAAARRFLDARDGRPSFCWLHVYDPHAPYQAPSSFAAQFPGDPYHAEVAATDDALAAVLRPLLDAGRDGRTLVVLTADHGESLGEHGELTHGLFAYEATLHVPLVMYAPRLLGPGVVSEPVRHVDIVPTVLDALGQPVPADLPGRSLLPAAAGERLAPAPAYFEALTAMLGRGWAPLYGVVQGDDKLIDLPLPEMYDLGRDPEERDSVIARAPVRREDLSSALARYRARDGGPARQAESGETRRQLAALGYTAAAAAPQKKQYTADDDPKRLVGLDRLMQEVIGRHRSGDLAGALAVCERVVRLRPDMSAGLLQMALLHRRLGQLGPAVAALRLAFQLDPDDAGSAVLLASYLSEAGEAKEAADLLAPYAAQPEPALDVLATRGAALAQLGRTREALDAFTRARRADPSNPMTSVQLATVHLAAGQTAEARRALTEALAQNPSLATAHRMLGLIAAADGRDTEAEARLRKALELDPGEHDALLNLGLVLRRHGRDAEARPLLERFVAEAPQPLYAAEVRRLRGLLSVPPGSRGR